MMDIHYSGWRLTTGPHAGKPLDCVNFDYKARVARGWIEGHSAMDRIKCEESVLGDFGSKFLDVCYPIGSVNDAPPRGLLGSPRDSETACENESCNNE